MRKAVKILDLRGRKKKSGYPRQVVLPADWRLRELGEGREVLVVKGKESLKAVPKKRVDLTRFFDSVDLETNLGDWEEFEKELYEVS